MHIVLAHAQHIRLGVDARLRHHGDPGGDTRQELKRGIQRRVKSVQVAVIDTHQANAKLQRPLQFLDVMHFDQDIHAQCLSLLIQVGHACIVQRSHYQQDAIGANGTCFTDLIAMHNEVLANHRQRAGVACRDQIIFMALKKVCVGQHRKARGATFGITHRNIGRREIFTDQPFGGRRLLDFGNDRRIALGDTLVKGGDEAPRGALFRGQTQQLGLRNDTGTLGHLLLLALEDTRQNGRAIGSTHEKTPCRDVLTVGKRG